MSWTVYSSRYADGRADSDADFRLLGKWISDRLTDLGWAKTADPQVDWGTVTKPAGANTKATNGYEIRKSTMSSADIYLKITYGTGLAATNLGIWLQTGDGSDGSGALTGDTTTEQNTGTASGSTGTYEVSLFVCGDGGNFVLAATDPNQNDCSLGGVQRTCDANGADTATGYYLYRIGYSATLKSTCQYCSFASGVASQDDSPGFGVLNLPRQVITTSSIQCLPLYAQNGLTWAPMRDVMIQVQGSMLCDFETPNYGTTRRYKTIFVHGSSANWGFTSSCNYGAGIRLT